MNRAQLLRKKATQPERILWRHLLNRDFAGYKFRRQYPFDDYVLDFYCPDAKLAIEFDGCGHPLPLAKGDANSKFRLRTSPSMRRLFVLCILLTGAILTRAEPPSYLVFVSNERSDDITVIDGASEEVVATFRVGKRPRGIHATPDGRRVFVTLSGSPRMAPGLDENRAPADKRADGLGVIDPVARKLIDRWHVGSDPEQFAISKDGKFAFIANEDDASATIIDRDSGQSRGRIKVSEEPEGVGVNPVSGEVYVTC